MNKIMAIASPVLLSFCFTVGLQAMPLGTIDVPGNELVQSVNDSALCAGIKAQRANVQDSGMPITAMSQTGR